MKKIFLIPMMAIMCTISAWGVDVANEADLRDAIAGASGETQINLTDKITVSEVCVIPAGKNIILNLNSYGMSTNYPGNAQATLTENSVISNEGTLRIISNGKGIIQLTSAGGDAAVIENKSTLIIDGGIFIGAFIKDEENGYAWRAPVIWNSESNSSLTINGGTFLQSPYELTEDERASSFFDDRPGRFYFMNIFPSTIYGTTNRFITGGVFSDDIKSNMSEENKLTHNTSNVPYLNANISGYNNSESLKNVYIVHPNAEVASSIGTDDTKVIKLEENTFVTSDDAAAKFIYIAPGKRLTIEKGAKLHVGEGGIVMGGTDSRLIVEAGATLLSEGDIVTSADENVQLTMDARNDIYSTLALKANNIQAKHPNATVTLNSVCNFDGATYKWQRFAVPTYLSSIKKGDFIDNNGGEGHYSVVYGWDYNADDWSKLTNDNDVLLPFQCYDMTIDHAGPENYVFKCELVGNGNPSIALHNEWNYLANSYTAPMSVSEIIRSFANGALGMNASVWAQKEPGSTSWKSATLADVYFDDLTIKKINPMQAFVFYNNNAENLEINYEGFVYNPLTGTNEASYAPARHKSLAEDITRAHIIVADENGGEETVMLYLSDDFSAALDNGFDVPKYINEGVFNFYAVTDLGNLERVGSNNLDEIALVLETKDATSFTMKFDKVTLEGYAIRDNLTEEVISITAENEYAFTAEDNATIADRFVVVKGTATAIDNTEAASAKKGIYSLTGVYMGENFHVLPAGVYIMNGKKVVK